MSIEYRVWWIPQIPMKEFVVPVASVAEGKKICDVLANYDQFQFDNNVKGDYCNMGGVSFKFDPVTDGEWHDWPEDEFEVEYLLEELNLYGVAHDNKQAA